MKTIGLIGGMSWQSSALYYRLINEDVAGRLGGAHSARCLMSSVDFGEIERLQHVGDWARLGALMAAEARALERGGADFIVLCTNTMHRLTAEIEAAISIPFLHIADPAGEAMRAAGITRAGLLGTAFTMEQGFYADRLAQRFGIDTLIPGADDRAVVHRVIYDELIKGRINPQSRSDYALIIERLAGQGAEAIILGCTEIPLLIGPDDSPVPVFDTTALHARAAVDMALQ